MLLLGVEVNSPLEATLVALLNLCAEDVLDLVVLSVIWGVEC